MHFYIYPRSSGTEFSNKGIRFTNAINNTIINTLNCDDNNITRISTEHFEIMTNITNRILKFKPTIKKPIVEIYTFFTIITFSKFNSFACTTSIVLQRLQKPFIKN